MLCIGHRGARGYEPENTLRSIRKALELGTPWVEIDVWNVEQRLLVIHDEELERTTNGTGKVSERSFAYVRRLDAGLGEQVPTLEEVFDCVDCRAGINIELKGPETALLTVDLVAQYIHHHGWTYDQILVSSFDHAQLYSVKAAQPEIRLGALIQGIPLLNTRVAQKMGAYSINLHLRTVNRRLVRDAHKRGLQVYVYTVNEPGDIERMRRIGVDGIFCDYPDRVLEHG